MKRVNFRLFALAIALVATSCVKDVVVDSNFHGTPSEKICFGAELKDTGEDTRGGVVSNRVGKHDLKSADGEFVLPMGVYVEDGIGCADAAETRGALFTNAGEIDDFTVWAKHKVGDNVSAYFNGVVFTKNTKDNIFYSPTGEEYMWPGDGNLTFVAVTNAPNLESVFVPNCTADSEDILESFTYTVPTDATAQNDIVLAKATYDGGYEASAPLKFEHIMTAVNVQIGAVSAGTIKSITFKGVYNKGSYNVDTNKWIVDTSSKADYSVICEGGGNSFTTTGSQESGTPINADNATFMFIPQEPGAGAVMEIVFNNGNKTETLTGKIEGDIWDKGKTVNYKLSIDKDFTLKVEPDPTAKKLDAHFIITDVFVTVAGNISNWKIEASADDNAKVTIIPYDEANPLAQQGFWTDVEVDENGEETTKSARGESEYKGSGSINEKRFLVFIPENITGKDRQITITLSSTDTGSKASSTKVLLQKFPNWTGDIGWEVVDDNEEGKYGFIWDRVASYVFLFSYSSVFGMGDFGTNYSGDQVTSFINSIINPYNNGQNITSLGQSSTNWISIVQFDVKDYWAYQERRQYIYLNYELLNNLNALSKTEGLENTINLYSIGGSATTLALETAIQLSKKAKGDDIGKPAFDKVVSGDRWNNNTEFRGDDVPAESGNVNDLSGILTYIQKKNRYCLQIKSTDAAVTYHPYFKLDDLKWFLPACNQFTNVDFTPENPNDKASDYWSSTAESGATYAYPGAAKTPISRKTELSVIAARKNEKNISPATISEINTEEMKGGENGEAQWVE